MQIPLKQTLCATLVLTPLLLPITGQAATYYVAPTGNDASACTQAKSASTPKKTIPAGVKCLAGGDTLIIKAGTYVGQQVYNPPPGTASAYTVIKGDPSGPRPLLIPTGATQRGFYCDRGEACRYIEIRYLEVKDAYNYMKLPGNDTVGYPHHVRIIDNILHDSRSVGILIGSSVTGFRGGDHLIQGNEIYRTGSHSPGYGPGYNSIYNPGNRSIIERNKFHNNNHGVGIWQTGSQIHNVIVRSNVFYDIGRHLTDTWQVARGSAVHVSVPGGGHKIYNNIIYRSGDSYSFTGIVVKTAFTSDTNRIYNNTIYDIKNSYAYGILINTTTGTHFVRNNIAYQAGKGITGGSQSNNLKTNPSFRDATRGNFMLMSGSAAIDKGLILSEVPMDYAGARRPAGSSHDIGAYETGATSTLAAPTSLSAQ
jgi:serralysin